MRNFCAGKAFALYSKVIRDVELTAEEDAYMKKRQDEFFDYVHELLTTGSTPDEFREGQALLGKVMLCALKCEMDIDTANSGISMGVVSSAKSLKDIRTDYRIATNLCKLGTGAHTAELRWLLHACLVQCMGACALQDGACCCLWCMDACMRCGGVCACGVVGCACLYLFCTPCMHCYNLHMHTHACIQ